MSAYTTPGNNQNQAGEQYAANVPTMPGYDFQRDAPFQAMCTPQQQIHWLYRHLIDGVQESDIDELNELVKGLSEETENLLSLLKSQAAALAELQRKVAGLAEQTMAYDVTRGVYRPSVAVERRMWQAHAPWGYSVEDMAGKTVERISEITCMELAKSARYALDADETPRDLIAEQSGYETARFDPADYIRRDELEPVEVSNLQDHAIYGLPEKSKSVPLPVPAALMRRGNVTDLKQLGVLWNNHLFTYND